MNMKQLKYVLVLNREGSFSKAAEILGISQPSLSQYIKKIESEIGLELFDRTNGDVRLTDAGRVYIEAGRQILDLEHQMKARFSDIAANKEGSVIIGASPYRTAGMMPEVARRFRQLYPRMHLVVCEGTTFELADGMAHGEYDMCLTILPVDDRLFAWEKVVEEELILAVPAGYPSFQAMDLSDRKYQAVDAGILKGHSFVMLTDAQFMQKQLQNLAMDYGLMLHTAAVVKSLEAQIEMVRAGVGMALVPVGIERFCRPGEVTFYSFAQELPKREVIVMWRKDRVLSKAAQELKSIICAIPW